MTRAPSPTCRPRGPRPEPDPPVPAEAGAEATTATPAASADVLPAIRELAAFLSPALAAEVERGDRVRRARFLYLARRYVSRGESRSGAARWSAIRILDEHEPGTARDAAGDTPARSAARAPPEPDEAAQGLILLCQLSQAELCLGLITIGPPECDPHLQLSESDNRVDETGAKMPQPVQIALASYIPQISDKVVLRRMPRCRSTVSTRRKRTC